MLCGGHQRGRGAQRDPEVKQMVSGTTGIQWNPSEALTAGAEQTPQGYLQSPHHWRRRQFERKDVGGDTDRRKCVLNVTAVTSWTHFLSQFFRSEILFLWLNVYFFLSCNYYTFFSLIPSWFYLSGSAGGEVWLKGLTHKTEICDLFMKLIEA